LQPALVLSLLLKQQPDEYLETPVATTQFADAFAIQEPSMEVKIDWREEIQKVIVKTDLSNWRVLQFTSKTARLFPFLEDYFSVA
jgi:hypothetical protein